jgi:N-acetylmuramoyl-L-alanine amidase
MAPGASFLAFRSLLLVLLPVLGLSAPARAASSAGPPAEDRFDTVVIDAGHGGEDHGARGPEGLVEKDLVLDLARRLAERLAGQGLRVVMTRDEDGFVPLDERTRIANAAAADLFVSIHANASRLRGVQGIETFFASLEASDEAAEQLAERENLAFGSDAGPGVDDPLLAILGDLLATEHLADAQEFARLTQRRIATAEASRSRGVKQAPFVVLMGVRMPAVLVEVGFLTNAVEELRLSASSERERLVGGIADAVATFRQRQDARLGLADAKGDTR